MELKPLSPQTRPAIAEAWGVVQYLSADEEARRLAEYEEMARRDEADRQKGAFKDGLRAVGRNMLRKNMSHADISELTGLSLEDVQRIAADLTDWRPTIQRGEAICLF